MLLITTDQQRWNALGCNGNADILTPHLDRLAAQGTNFSRCFVQNPVCMPSRVSFLTGQYPGTLGITHMGVPVPADACTLPRMLRNSGYRSANIGKLHFLPHANRDHREIHPDYGFDHLEISDEPGCYDDAYHAYLRAAMPEQLPLVSCGLPPAAATWQREMGLFDRVIHPETGREEHRARAFAGSDEATHSAFVAAQTIDWLAQNRHSPFLCIAGFYSPHSPWIAPQRFLDLYDPQKIALPTWLLQASAQGEARPGAELRQAYHGYYAMISEVDFQVGRILESLETQGLADDTLVVFTSDHGEWLGAHGRYGKGYPGDDVVSRVPLIVRWPKGSRAERTHGGRALTRIVEAIDVVPTLLEAAGIPVPPHLQGTSLLGELPPAGGAALMEMSGWKSLRTDDFRYVAHADGREALFDLQNDVGEAQDVAAEMPVIVAAHRAQLLQRLIARERPLARMWSY